VELSDEKGNESEFANRSLTYDEIDFVVYLLNFYLYYSFCRHALTHFEHAFESDTRARVHNDFTITIFHVTISIETFLLLFFFFELRMHFNLEQKNYWITFYVLYNERYRRCCTL